MGTFPNLMDNHPMMDGYVFQIDGNFGASAAMIEMLVKSKENRLELLPAINKETDCGNLSGVRLRCGAELSMLWKDGKVTWLKIHPDRLDQQSCQIMLCYNGIEETVILEQNKDFIKNC